MGQDLRARVADRHALDRLARRLIEILTEEAARKRQGRRA
jgi:hypothetical protein